MAYLGQKSTKTACNFTNLNPLLKKSELFYDFLKKTSQTQIVFSNLIFLCIHNQMVMVDMSLKTSNSAKKSKIRGVLY